MRKWTTLAAGLALLPLLVGCGSSSEASAAPDTTMVVLFDLSGSAASTENRERYMEQFGSIVQSLEPGTRIVADFITDSPLAQSSFPVNHEVRKFESWSDNKIKWEQETEETRAEILSQAEEVLADSTRSGSRTPIIEATQLAERVFNTYEGEQRVLVVFSDMVEESELADFSTGFDVSTAESTLESLESAERLPELAGVRVHVVGASSGTYEEMSIDQRDAIRDFWLGYFSAAGADASRDRYGSALLQL